jgi:hypothetical protein
MPTANPPLAAITLKAATAHASVRICLVLMAVSLVFGPVTVFAQDAVSPGLIWPHLIGSAEISVADKYIYRGYVVENHGPVVQPYLDLSAEFYRGSRIVNSASLKVSVFSSLQFHKRGLTKSGKPMRWWYELQIEPGIELVFAKDFTFTAIYRRFESPNGVFDSFNEIELALALDDTRFLGSLALHPHVLWAAPVANGHDAGAEEGHYFEAGIAPSAAIGKTSRYPVTVELPVNAGFGDSRYYAGEHFGYLSAGVALSIPLAFLPSDYGAWTFGGSATYYYLGRNAAESTNDGQRNDSVFAVTLSTAF